MMKKKAKKNSQSKHAKISFDKKVICKKGVIWLRNIVLFFFGSTIFMVVLYKFVPVYITPLMVFRCAEQIINEEELKMRVEWVPLEEVSPNVVTAVVSAEDNKFLSHNGFDYDAIKVAWKKNHSEKARRGGRIYGASTISQQTAKNVFLWSGRSWFRKGLEVYFTSLIEFVWGKRRIMEVYVNVIEVGDGIYGVERAAEIYYHTEASKLSKAQSAMIAVSLPNPRRFNVATPSAYMHRRQRKILSLMQKIGEIQL